MMFVYYIAFIILRLTPAISGFTECAPSSSSLPGNEQIVRARFLANDISSLYLNERFSDVVLVVENEKLHAHRFLLASRSDFFKVLLYGDHKEAREMSVPIREASATSFKILLEYIYSGRMDLSILEGNIILELLILTNKFCFSNLQFSLSKFLISNISMHNVSSLLTVALLYQLKEIEVASLDFIDTHTLDVLESEDYLSLSPEAFELILHRDMAYSNELDIRVFRATCRWIKINQDNLNPDAKNNILSAVRYQFMNDEELSEVRQLQLVCSGTVILESLTRALDYREELEPNVNFAQGTLEGPSQIDGGTMIMLDHPSHINYIEMMLSDEDTRTYSYYIEVSMDKHDWMRVINHSKYHCRLVQRLWFHRRFVQYIRIVGTENTGIMTFKCLKIMYNTDKLNLMEIKNGLVAPEYNVALASMSATVIQGKWKLGCNTLVDGDYKNYEKDHGTLVYQSCTYHSLKSGCINVQLAQPYVLSSMRILLWDCDIRSYSYTVEVSINNLKWEMIVDKSNMMARSWQLLEFDARPVVYIRITGVFSSKRDGLFKCVHLETPAQESPDPNIVPLKPKTGRSKYHSFGK